MTTVSSCPLCGGETVAAFTTSDRNRAISTRRFLYRRCLMCATLHLDEVPENLGRYYPQDYYQLPSRRALDRAARSRGEVAKLDLLRAQRPPGQLLEIGAGFGVFARAAHQAGFAVTAIEMDARCCEYLEHVVGVKAICSDTPEELLPRLPASETVVLWHVLEHLPRPWDVLEGIAANLTPGGVLALAVPNPDALQFCLLRGRWAHVDAPRHLFLIPSATLIERAGQLGLRLAHITTSDPAGRLWNRFGWEYALRRFPAVRRSTVITRGLALLGALALSPLETRGLYGTAYTAVFVKDGGSAPS
jgi:SAM-dependent methyltransferase